MPLKTKKRRRKGPRLPLFDRITLLLLFIFLVSNFLGGAIRYYAAAHGFAWVAYLPHLLLALGLVPLLVRYLSGDGVTSTYAAIFALFGVGVIYGLLNLNSADQVIFGVWVLVAFLFGVVALPAVVRGWRRLKPYVLLLWGLALVGVLINVFYQWPWVGFEYQVGTTSIEASRLWTVAGLSIVRLPGFSRASFNAAVQILVPALFLREIVIERRWWIPMWILSGVAIVLTTSKSVIGAYLLFSLMWFFYSGRIRPSWRAIPTFMASFDILLPFSTLFVKPDWLSSIRRMPVGMMLIGSFAERLEIEWPAWIKMTVAHGSAILGRGVGGIGSATVYFEPALINAGDNLAVYLYGAFGILGLALLWLYGWKASCMRTESDVSRFLFFCVCLVLLKGLTEGVMEGPTTAVVFGMSLRYALESPEMIMQLGRLRSWGARTSKLTRSPGVVEM